ncbi:hypothetical protein [Streptomyces sp. NPDC058665]|uniref:hypothetical protein n=1 Tax=Streptomyces sp. NPDC058665 TaxID=3346586 RepID=UPI003656FC4A
MTTNEQGREPAAARDAIVTGGSRGNGRAVPGKLAREGLAVVVNHARDAAAAEETVKELHCWWTERLNPAGQRGRGVTKPLN